MFWTTFLARLLPGKSPHSMSLGWGAVQAMLPSGLRNDLQTVTFHGMIQVADFDGLFLLQNYSAG